MDKRQPYIHSPFVDSVFILLPPFLCLAVVMLFPGFFQTEEMPDMVWLLLIVFIDVAHVYSTLYRTYFDKETYIEHKSIMLYIPLFAYIVAVLIFSLSSLWFWRLLAYVAVFHFIRQQYGFMRIYSRTESASYLFKTIDAVTIYYATIYPILFWHLNSPRNFNWFISGDFLYFNSDFILYISTGLYILILAFYFVKEIIQIFKSRHFNIPRNLLILGTILSWFFGIVYYNADLVFTVLNVVSHGIPYMALVWIAGRKKHKVAENATSFVQLLFSKKGIALFIGILFLLAFIEEGLWDRMIWGDHDSIFSVFSFIPSVSDKHLHAFLVPLLALPQLTHYILDGFIWKLQGQKSKWKAEVLDTSR